MERHDDHLKQQLRFRFGRTRTQVDQWLVWLPCTTKVTISSDWCPKTAEMGYIIIKDSRVAVYAWEVADFLPMRIKKCGSTLAMCIFGNI